MSDRILRIDITSSTPLFGKTTLAAVIAKAIKEQFPAQHVEVLSQENDFLLRAEDLALGAPCKIQADVVQIVDINANPQPLREGAIYSTIPVDIQEMTHEQLDADIAAPTVNTKPLWENAPEWAMWLLKDHGEYTWAEVAPDAQGGIAGRFVQAGIYTEGSSVGPEARPQAVDDMVNYPERPYTLDALLSRAVTSAMGKDTTAEFQAMLIVDMVRNDPMFRQAAEEFEADRGDQYEWLTTGYARPDIVVPATAENGALLLEAILKIDGLPNEWFSMDSAPKDGTPIYGIDETMENDETQNCVEVIRWQKEGYWAHSNGEYSFQPTRWQPVRYPRASNDGLITPASVDQAQRDDDAVKDR